MSRSVPASIVLPQDWATWVSERPADGGSSGADWIGMLPRLLEECLTRWDLRPVGGVMTGWTAAVVPVERVGEQPAGAEGGLVLKIVWPHPEARDEALALRLWAGNGSVRLVAADPSRWALLLERLDAESDLESEDVDIEEACGVIGGLLRRLHMPPSPAFARVETFLEPHLRRLDTDRRVPRRVATRVRGLACELFDRPHEEVLLHGDLHFANVLAAGREPWLAIDPKPMLGHPGFEIQPVLRNRAAEMGTGAAFRWSVRRRLDVVCDALGLDPEVGRAWSILHSGFQVLWAAGDGADASVHLAIMKALDD